MIKFVLGFSSSKGRIIHKSSMKVGTQLTLKLPFPEEDQEVSNHVDFEHKYNLEFNLSLEEALEIPHFKDNGYVSVSVQENGLNKFTELSMYKTKYKVQYIWKVNTERLLQEWRAAGYPLDWDTDAETYMADVPEEEVELEFQFCPWCGKKLN